MPKQSFALTCAEPSPPDVAYNEYDAVIIGTVQKIKENNGKKILTIKVDKSFKGVDKKIITVEEDITWGESQFNFDYLYFLNKEGENWVHPLCSPTTNNASIADNFLADKEEISLKNVMVNKIEAKDTVKEVPLLEDKNDTKKEESNELPLVVLLVVISTLVVVVIITSKRKKNN
jgi:hypothetical protein